MPALSQATAEDPAPSRFRQRLDGVCEKGILGIVALAILWGPLAFGGIPLGAFVVIQGLTVLALGLWVVRIWAHGAFRLLWPPVCWAVYVFLLYALVRCRLVLIEYPARMELIQIVVYASLFFIVINSLTRRESATVIALCLIGLALVLSWDAVYQFATKSATTWGVPRRAQFLGRGSGTYINPNHLADLLAMTIPLALSYTLMSRLKPTLKVVLAYGALVMLAGVGVSVSRGGILATGAIMVVFCLMLLFQRGYGLPALVLLIVVVALAAGVATQLSSVRKRFDDAFRYGQVLDIRADYWPAAVHIFEDHPWWGGGPAHFDWEFARYRPRPVQIRPVYAHNDYLNTMGEWGLAGTAIIAATFGLLYYGAWRTWQAVRLAELQTGPMHKSDKSAFFIGACLGLLAILIHSVVDFNFHVPANAVVAVTFMGLIAAHCHFVTDRYWENVGLIGKILLTLALGGTMAWLAAFGVQTGREAFWLHRAADERAAWNDRLAALQNAYATEPADYANAYNLGEYHRLTSFEGNPGYQLQTLQAMQWYSTSMALNPLDAFVPMRYGMCLDWIGRTNEATAYFDQAQKLDPNNSKVAYYHGRHSVELGDYPAAKRWFELSIGLEYTDLAGAALSNLKQRMEDPAGLYK